MKFEGTRNYISTDDLNIAVNAAITLEKPLLIKGEPGTGKTEIAIILGKMYSKSFCWSRGTCPGFNWLTDGSSNSLCNVLVINP
mgnify:CR=1 FL=1